jgi:hypothetical protein
MDTLLSKEETAKLYKTADAKGKKLMEKMYRMEDLVLPPKPKEPLTDWEPIAKLYKKHPVKSLPYPNPKDDREKRMNVHFVMDVMVEYFNTDPITKEVWEPTYPGNGGHRIWYEYKSGVGFVFYDSNYDNDFAFVGSRLHAKNGVIAKLIGEALTKYQNQLFKTSK